MTAPIRSAILLLGMLFRLIPSALAESGEGAPSPPQERLWQAEVQASLLHLSGNSEALTISGESQIATRKEKNRFSMEAKGARGEAVVEQGNDTDGNGMITRDEIARTKETAVDQWAVLGRFDRFVTDRNSLFLSSGLASDRLSGLNRAVHAQPGVSRILLMNDRQELKTDIGYDFRHESYVAGVDPDAAFIHSARVAGEYRLTLSKHAGLKQAVETLANLNRLPDGAGPGRDTRLNSKTALTFSLWGPLSFRISITFRYDRHPPGKPEPFDPSIRFEQFDTRTETALVLTLL